MRKIAALLISLTLTISAVAILYAAFALPSEDDWSMFHCDPAHTGYTTTKPLTIAPVDIWNKTGGYQGVNSSPAIVDGIIYVTAQSLYAFNASTGEEIWRVDGAGWGANPIVIGDFVYCGGIAYDASTGTELWSPNPPGALVPQAYADGYLYAYAYNASFPQPGAGVVDLLCLNATTGVEIWRISVDFISTDPALANGVLYVAGSAGTFYAFDAYTGNEMWSYPLEASPSSSGSSPAVYGGVVFVGSFWDHNVYALNATNGVKIWNFTTGSFVESSPAVAKGIVYIGSDDGNFYALNATTGVKIWNYMTSGGTSAPAIAADVVYVGGFNGNLYALNASTGNKLWNYTIQKPPGFEEYSGLHTSPVVSNGRVYIGSNDYIMIALEEGTVIPTPPPPFSEPISWIILPLFIALAIIVVLVYSGKRKRQSGDEA